MDGIFVGVSLAKVLRYVWGAAVSRRLQLKRGTCAVGRSVRARRPLAEASRYGCGAAALWSSSLFLLLFVFVSLPNSLSARVEIPAEIMPLAERSVLLDIALAGDRLVAVGERGHILLSDDYGRTWEQVPVPTRSTLTAVFFADSELGWAVGHDNVVLATTDGGRSWNHQYAEGGIENRFLDVRFLDAERGFAVGAYGLFVETMDGGNRWSLREIFWEELHFNRISAAVDGGLFIALETGELLHSVDDGETWEEMDSPYDGSLFGVLPLGARTLLAYGLRGNVFRSSDGGVSWTDVESPAPLLVTHGARLSGGEVVLAAQNGQFFLSRDGGRSFALWRVPVQGAAALVEAPDGVVVAVGLNGVHRLHLPRREARREG
ncbi:MAG: hypothetical protein JJU00_10485 [Opitutales bacterium]|nr:hypothetical protein [Opitutales bacterium]